MSKIIHSFSLLVIVFCLFYNCDKENRTHIITKQDAENLLSSYVSTLKSGDTEEIKKYWSKKSLNRPGFDVMHRWIGRVLHISEWKDFLDSTQYTYRMKELLKRDGYYIINGEWTRRQNNSDPDEIHPMPFYLVWDNHWLLMNPIDILTQNWNRYETDHMVFFYSQGINIDDHLQEIRLLDEKFQSMCKAMDFSFDKKIEFYKTSSPEECGRLLAQPPFNGLAAVTYKDSIEWFQVAVSTTFYHPHEVMHIIALSSGIPASLVFFSEGLAVAYGGTAFQTAEYAHVYSKNSINNKNFIPIKKLLKMDEANFLRKNYITYQESGSFIRYLIETYGIDKMKDFITNFNKSGDLNAQSMEVYALSLDDLENHWKEYLREIKLPRIGFSVPEKAKLVFGMTDPKNDDIGDGDYQYPSNEKYEEGCFDLTNFEVFKDKDNVYFRIGLQKLIKQVTYRQGSVKFIPTTVIAINKETVNKRQLFKNTNEVEFADGYDLKINVGFGINIANNQGKIFMSTPDFYDEMIDFKSNKLTFSLPIAMIGEPEDEWRYFVGVGLADEPSFNFSGLAPVRKNIPVLIRGGNYDHSNPAFIDILLPENIDQKTMLSDYNPEKGKVATIRMVTKTGKGF